MQSLSSLCCELFSSLRDSREREEERRGGEKETRGEEKGVGRLTSSRLAPESWPDRRWLPPGDAWRTFQCRP